MSKIPSDDGGAAILNTFDRLAEARVDRDELTRIAAKLAGCPAGAGDHAGRPVSRWDAAGRPLSLERPKHSQLKTFGRGGTASGIAWLEPSGTLGPEGRLVLDRLAFTLGHHEATSALTARASSRRASALEVLLGNGAGELERASATRALSLDPRERVRVLWVVGHRDVRDAVAVAVRLLGSAVGDLLRWTEVDGRLLVLLPEAELDLVLDAIPTASFTVAVGPTEHAVAASVVGASVALRFAGAAIGPTTVRYDDLGTFTTLLTVPPDVADGRAEVRTLRRLAAARDGLQDLRCLEAFLRLGSLRAAARELYLHHSSVAGHLERVFAELGLDRDRPLHRWRAQTALALWMTSDPDDGAPRTGDGEPDRRRVRPRNDPTPGHAAVTHQA